MEVADQPPPPPAVAFAAAEPDTVVVVELDWPAPPSGEPSPAEWEDTYQEALASLARGETDLARDLMFSLQDLAAGPEPAEADTLYLEHRRSIRRRLALLSGLLAEQTAFSGRTSAPDSVLASEYLTARGLGMPDSLVPASGSYLSSLQADLLKVHHERVDRWLDYFTGRGRRHFQRWLDRQAEVGPLVQQILAEENLPEELIYLAMIESGLSTRARSSVGAVGPWQFMAPTGRSHGLAVNWWVDERRDLERSTRAACRYLRALHDEFGDWALVLAAYNSGEGRVRRQLRDNGHDNYWDYRLPRQTVDYVPKFIAAASIGADPAAYGFTVAERPALAVEHLAVNDATDLSLIATCAEVPEEQVYELNPALLRRATPPGDSGYLVNLPSGTADRARAALARIPATKRLTWRKHEVKRGETLGHIAGQWGTSVRAIQEANSLGKRTLIRPGDQLLIPMPRELQDLARKRAEDAGRYIPPQGHERVTYRVQSGDTLGAIARRLGVSVAHLKQVNGIANPRRLKIGQTLEAYRPPRKS
ncbi:MAG: LysM peptidoglycan-binding domain-containing protein [Candidatus Krumholzibacteriia bacterium]